MTRLTMLRNFLTASSVFVARNKNTRVPVDSVANTSHPTRFTSTMSLMFSLVTLLEAPLSMDCSTPDPGSEYNFVHVELIAAPVLNHVS